MKKTTKRIISFIFAVVLLLSFTTIAYAKDAEPRITFVGRLQIVSAPKTGSIGSAGISGHSFIVVKNTSDTVITVGHMPVKPGDSITIGTYGNRDAHKGIWYNIEGCTSIIGTSYGLACALTMSDIYTINNVINANDAWSLTKNCSYFAKTVWNAVYPTESLSGIDPLTLANSIQNKDFCVTNPAIPSKSKSDIARHTSSGYVYDLSGATSS